MLILLLLTTPLLVNAIFRGLEPSGALPLIDGAFKMSETSAKARLTRQLSHFTIGGAAEFTRSLASLHPSRLKRAANEGDISFAVSLTDAMRDMFGGSNDRAGKLTAPCLGDLLNFVNSFTRFLVSSGRVEHCTKKPVDDQCECLREESGNVTEHSWVLKFLDSMGKVPSGVLHGNMWFLGDFQQCMNIAKELPSGETYRGKFCLTKINMRESEPGQRCPTRPTWEKTCSRLPLPLNLGVCMPETCTEADMVTIVEEIMKTQKPKHPKRSKHENATELCLCIEPTCHKRSLPLDTKAIIVLAVLIVIAALMIAGSIYEYFVYEPQLYAQHGQPQPAANEPTLPKKGPAGKLVKNGAHNGAAASPPTNEQGGGARATVVETPKIPAATEQKFFDSQPLVLRIALAFSIISNGRKLFDTQKKPGQIHSIHGLRFLSLAWVILGHTYFWILPTLDNLIGVRPLTKNPMNQVILNATFCVDCFFLQSGFLLCYLWLKDTTRNKGRGVNSPKYWLMFYVHRYIRLTPVYALILAVDICLYRYITDGPFWNQNGLEPNYCRRSWWTNLLYLNNFLVQDELCMSWTWYLANDFQFYFFAPIILLLLWYYEVIGIAVAVLTLLATGVIKGVLTVANNLPPSSLASALPDAIATQDRYWNLIYVKPYCRCGVYIVGLLLGYLMFKLRGKKIRLHWAIVTAIWTSVTVMHLALLFGLYKYSSTGELPGKPVVFIYAMFARPLWGVGLAWIIFACEYGYGGWVNSILSWGSWIPLGKLTYCAYLLHAFVAHGTYNSRFQSAHFDTHLRMVYYFFGHLVVSYALAMVFHLAFEAPILTLERIIFRRKPRADTVSGSIRAASATAGAAAPSTSRQPLHEGEPSGAELSQRAKDV